MEVRRETLRRKSHEPLPTWRPDAVLGQQDSAALLGVSTRQLRRWNRAGVGPRPLARRATKGPVLGYELAELMAWRNRVLGAGETDPQAWATAWWRWAGMGGWRWPQPEGPRMRKSERWKVEASATRKRDRKATEEPGRG